jgi:hypothetical protein
MTVSRAVWPCLSRTSGAGTVPLMPIARLGLPSIRIVWRAMWRVMSLPDTVGRGAVMPGDTGCAQAGNHVAMVAAAPPPKAPLTNRRLFICMVFPTVSDHS